MLLLNSGRDYKDFERFWGVKEVASLPKVCIAKQDKIYHLPHVITCVTTQDVDSKTTDDGWEVINNVTSPSAVPAD